MILGFKTLREHTEAPFELLVVLSGEIMMSSMECFSEYSQTVCHNLCLGFSSSGLNNNQNFIKVVDGGIKIVSLLDITRSVVRNNDIDRCSKKATQMDIKTNISLTRIRDLGTTAAAL